MPLLKHFHWLLYLQGEVCLTPHLIFCDLGSACHFSLLALPPNEIICCFPKAPYVFFRPPVVCTSCFLRLDYSSQQVFIEQVVSAGT